MILCDIMFKHLVMISRPSRTQVPLVNRLTDAFMFGVWVWIAGQLENKYQNSQVQLFYVHKVLVYPLVNVYITMENHHFSWENSL